MKDVYTLKVSPENKIIDIKAKIKSRYGSYINEQILFFNKIETENNKTLQDYSIQNNSTLDLIVEYYGYTEIIIKPPIGEPFPIEINQSSIIKEVKDEIYNIKGIPQNQQKIIYKKRYLDDYDIILKSGVDRYSRLHLTYPKREPITLLIKLPKSKAIQYDLDKFDKIKDIKYKIENKVKEKPHLFKSDLIFAGVRLDDSKMINDYLIPEKAVLDYIAYPSNKIVIFIRINGNLNPIDVCPNEKIIDIKKQIEDLTSIQISKQSLTFDSKELNDQKQLQDYFVYFDAIIELKTEKNQQIKIYVKMPSEKQLSFDVNQMSEIKYIKMLIESKTGIKSSDQRLIFQCKQLEDNFTLKYYSIKNDSMILLVPFQRQNMKITVNSAIKDQMIFDVNPTDFIKDIKSKINEKTGYPIEKQVLQYEQIFLNDNDSFQVYSIMTDTTIDLITLDRGGFVILVKMAYNEFIPIEIKNDDRIEYIKKEIEKRKGIPIDQQQLCIDFDELNDYQNVAHYSLSNGQILRYVHYEKDSFVIYVKLLTGKHAHFYFRSKDQTIVIKEAIEKMEGIDKIHQRLIYGGKQLENEMTLEDYNIKRESTIHLVLRLR